MKQRHIFGFLGLVIIIGIILALVLPGKDVSQTQEDTLSEVFTEPDTYIGAEGEFVYSFDGITWDLEAIEGGSARVPETKVGFFFDQFTRREEGVPASFNSPFHLGFYKGDCTVLEENTTNLTVDVISSIECTWEEETTMLALAQDANIVSAYEVTDAGVEVIRQIDITEIVR